VAVTAPLLLPSRARLAYRRVVVPIAAGDGWQHAMTAACRLAAERGAAMIALAVIEVPAELPLEAHMVDEEEQAAHLLREAEAIGDAHGVTVAGRTIRARKAGPAIVARAEAEGAELVVLRAPRRARAGRHAPIFGTTVSFVLKHASCRVIVSAPPV
jgi:nucleotide-binding universal stress UspA family protein